MRDMKMITAVIMLASGLFLAQGAEAQINPGDVVDGQLQEGLLTKVMVGTNQGGAETVTVEINDQNYTLWAPPSDQEFQILDETGNKRTVAELGQNIMIVRYRLRNTTLGPVIDRIECPCPPQGKR